MYTYPGKAKAAIYTIAACMARAGQSNSQPDARRKNPPTVHQNFPQEVTVILVPAHKGKAAVAAAAQSAHLSAIQVNLIVPPHHRNAMGFNPFLPPIFPFQPLPNHMTFPLPA